MTKTYYFGINVRKTDKCLLYALLTLDSEFTFNNRKQIVVPIL